MAIVIGDITSVGSLGMLRSRAVSSIPSTPTLSLVTATGQVTATITGDAGVTNYLKYKAPSDSAWQDGGSRSGDGDLVVTGLSNDVPYVFVAYSIDADGVASLPSMAATATLTAAADNDFDDYLDDSASEFLTAFGVNIKYLPKGGGERQILAIVDIGQPNDLDGAPHGNAPLLTISVANDSTTGISSSEVDTGGDKVELALRLGDTVQQRRITEILEDQDVGMMRLEIR